MKCDVKAPRMSSMTAVFNTVLYKKNPRCAYCSQVLVPAKYSKSREQRFTREYIVPLSVIDTLESAEKITALSQETPREFLSSNKRSFYKVLAVHVSTRKVVKLEDLGIDKEYYNFLVDIYRFLPLIDSPANVIQCCHECNKSRGNSFEFIRNNPLELNPFHYQLVLSEFANRPQTRNPQSPRFGQVITLEFYETLARHNFVSERDKFILRWVRSLVDKELRYYLPPLGNATPGASGASNSSDASRSAVASQTSSTSQTLAQGIGSATAQPAQLVSAPSSVFHTFSIPEVLDLVSDGRGLWCTDVVRESLGVLSGFDKRKPFDVGLSEPEVSFFHRKAVLHEYGSLVSSVVSRSAPPLHCDSFVVRKYARRKGLSFPVFDTHLSGIVQLTLNSF